MRKMTSFIWVRLTHTPYPMTFIQDLLAVRKPIAIHRTSYYKRGILFCQQSSVHCTPKRNYLIKNISGRDIGL